MKRNSFINECAEDETRFSKPIKKTKIVNFAISNFQKKNKSQKVSKIASIRDTRDIFGRLLYLAVTNGMNLEKLFEYFVLPVSHIHMELYNPRAKQQHTIIWSKIKIFNHQTCRNYCYRRNGFTKI